MSRRFATSILPRGLMLASCLIATFVYASVASAGLLYVDQTKVNLASSREAVSFGIPSASGSATTPSRPNHGTDFRVNPAGPGNTNGKYVIDLGRAYDVSSYNFTIYSGLYSSFNGVVRTSLDNITYSTPVGTFTGTTTVAGDGNHNQSVNGTFPSTMARYVQLDVASWAGFGQAIVSKVGIYGNNPGLITTQGRFSIANNISNGGTASVIDPWNNPVTPQNLLAAVDDGIDPLGRGNTILSGSYWPGGALQSNPGVPTGNPTQFTLALNDNYFINRVAAATISDSRRWKDVNIYTSPDASGNTFTLQQSLTNIVHAAGFFESTLPGIVDARRVRFDVLNTYPSGINGSTGVADTWIGELYAFAAPQSPPVLDSNPTNGGTIQVPYMPGQVGIELNALTLSNVGGYGSIIDVNSFTITPGFTLLNFNPSQLVVGLSDSIPFDISFDPLVNPSGVGVLMFLTSEGPLTFNLQATVVPEPSTFALLGLGALGVAVRTRRRKPAAA